MEPEISYPIVEICSNYQIEFSFIEAIAEAGVLGEDISLDNGRISQSQLSVLEKTIEFYFNLGVNFEGIEVIVGLLDRINEMQEKMSKMSNELSFYKNESR